MNSISLNKIYRQGPATWNELTREQLLWLAPLMPALKSFFSRKPTVAAIQKLYQLKLSILFVLYRIPKKIFRAINPVQMEQLLSLIDFVITEKTLTKNLLPSFRINARVFHGPADGMKNICASEFAFADSFYLRYFETGDEKFLDFMIASLYRPAKLFHFVQKRMKNYDGDIRKKFNRHHIDFLSLHIKTLPQDHKLAILLFYEGCREMITRDAKYDKVFTSKPDESKTTFGWPGIIIELAGPKFGNVEETGTHRLHTILMHLQMLGIQREEWERQIEKQKSEAKRGAQ